MNQGTVHQWNSERGFGRVRTRDADAVALFGNKDAKAVDAFFHYSATCHHLDEAWVAWNKEYEAAKAARPSDYDAYLEDTFYDRDDMTGCRPARRAIVIAVGRAVSFDITMGDRGPVAKKVLCPGCAQQRERDEADIAKREAEEEAARATDKRMLALFEKGYRFPVPNDFPIFFKVKKNDNGEVVLPFGGWAPVAFDRGAREAITAGANDDEIRAAGEAACLAEIKLMNARREDDAHEVPVAKDTSCRGAGARR